MSIVPRRQSGNGSPRNHQKARPTRPPILGDLLRRLQGSQTAHGQASASSRVLRVVARSYQLKYWFAATICAAT